MVDLNRRVGADRGVPQLLATFARNAERQTPQQRDNYDAAIEAGLRAEPISSWVEVAAWVSDDVWERILNDMPVSRRELERIRPSLNAPTLATQSPAA